MTILRYRLLRLTISYISVERYAFDLSHFNPMKRAMPMHIPKGLWIMALMLFLVPGLQAASYTFTYTLSQPASTSAGVYDSQGRLVKSLWSLVAQSAGTQTGTWDGTDQFRNFVPVGNYYHFEVAFNAGSYSNVGAIGNFDMNTAQGLATTGASHTPITMLSIARDSNDAIYTADRWDEAGADFKKWDNNGNSVYDAQFQIRNRNSPNNGLPLNGTAYAIATDPGTATGAFYCSVMTHNDQQNKNPNAPQVIERFDMAKGRDADWSTTYSYSNADGTIQVYSKAPVVPSAVSNAVSAQDANILLNPLVSLAVSGNTLLVVDALGGGGNRPQNGCIDTQNNFICGQILMYDKTSGAQTGQFAVIFPQALAVDSKGQIWVGHQHGTVSVYSVTGRFITDVITDLHDVVGLAFGPDGKLYVADQGIGQIKIYTLSGNNTATLVGTLGQKAQDGDRSADHFFHLQDVGVDSQGNIFTLQTEAFQLHGPSGRLAKWSPQKALLWEIFGSEFVSIGNYDSKDPSTLYSSEGHSFHLQSLPNITGWQYLGNAYSQDIGYHSSPHGAMRVLTLNGHRFEFVPTGDGVQIYHVDGTKLQLASLVGGSQPYADGTNLAVGEAQWTWHNMNGNSLPAPSEIQWYSPLVGPGSEPYYGTRGMQVDSQGNIWFADDKAYKGVPRDDIWEIPVQGFDGKGNPVYDWSTAKEVIPKDTSPFGFQPKVVQHADDGSFYATGLSSSTWPIASNRLYGGSNVLVRYDKNGHRLWAVQLPDICTGMDLAPGGKGVIVGKGVLIEKGKGALPILYHYSSDGLLLGEVYPTTTAMGTYNISGKPFVAQGALDETGSVAANRNPTDKMLDIFVEDDLIGRLGWFRIDDRNLSVLSGPVVMGAPAITTISAVPNPITGTSTVIQLDGNDPTSPASTLIYTWQAVSAVPSPVNFSVNGTTSAQTTTATFSQAGVYTLQGTLSDPGGLSVSSQVVVTVNPVLSSIIVTPPSSSLLPGTSEQMTATALDQFGMPLPTQPSFQWSTSGGGVIDSRTGLFVAGTLNGTFTVTAQIGSMKATAIVTVNLIKPTTIYNVQSAPFNAVGDGHSNDAPAIQAAINAACLAGGGTVYVPAGTYLLNGVPNYPSQNPNLILLLQPCSNVNIMGDGPNSILKVAPGLNQCPPSGAHIEFEVLWSPNNQSHPLSNCQFKNFEIDFNGQNNLVCSSVTATKNAGLGARYASDIDIEGMTFLNNPGEQSIQFGDNNKNVPTPQRITIRNNIFHNAADVISGNSLVTDHSAIYLQAESGLVEGNTFIEDALSHVATAMEIHTTHGLVQNNAVKNFNLGAILDAELTNLTNTRLTHNTFTNVNNGVHIDTYWGEGVLCDSNTIDHNTILLSADSRYGGIFNLLAPANLAHSSFSFPPSNLWIQSNTIYSDPSRVSSLSSSAGIHLAAGGHNLMISGNTLYNLAGRGISLGGQLISTMTASGLQRVDETLHNAQIIGNVIYDIGLSPAAQQSPFFNQGIVVNVDTFSALNTNVAITQNDVHQFASSAIHEGLHLNGLLSNSRNVENQFHVPQEINDIGFKTYGVSSCYIDQIGVGNPITKQIVAELGSHWLDQATGTVYEKIQYPSDFNGWIVAQKANSIALTPTDMDLFQGEPVQFTAIVMDQFGNPIDPQPISSWTITGKGFRMGSIDANGLYTAGITTGTFTVTISTEGLKAQALVTVLLNPALAPSGPGMCQGKKMIHYGWDIPDDMDVTQHAGDMEREATALSGSAIAVASEPPLSVPFDLNVLSANPYHLNNFGQEIAHLQAASWQQFTDNFLHIDLGAKGYVGESTPTWSDDGRWQTIANNFGVMASIAQQGKAKGIMIDSEPGAFNIWSYVYQNSVIPDTFPNYQIIAKQRGYEVMTAMEQAYPGLTLFFLLADGQVYKEWQTPTYNPNNLDFLSWLPTSRWALFPSFLDGMLEAAMPGTHIIDGFEGAYALKGASTAVSFAKYRDWITSEAPTLMSGDPSLYVQYIQVGFPIWIDSPNGQWDPADSINNYYSPPDLAALAQNAMTWSDQYVWLYSQRARFFPSYGSDGSVQNPSNISLTYRIALQNACTNGPILGSVVLTPSQTTVPVFQSQTFTGMAYDLSGLPLNPQPSFTWSLSGVGQLQVQGNTAIFSSQNSGSSTITVTSGGIRVTASIIVTPTTLPTPELATYSSIISPSYMFQITNETAYQALGIVPTFILTFSPQSSANGTLSYNDFPRTVTSGSNYTASIQSYAFSPSSFQLPLGSYQFSIVATVGTLQSQPYLGTITLASNDLSGVRVYPNPWRADRHKGLPLTFDHLPVRSTVRIFTLAGRWMKTLQAPDGSVAWDLTTDNGDQAASGIYFYVITNDQNQTSEGKLVLIR